MAELEAFRAQAEVEKQNEAIVRRTHDEVWSKGNVEIMDELYAPNYLAHWTGGGETHGLEEFKKIIAHGLEMSPTTEVLLEESVIGWKEFEMEVVRDKKDNCIIVCSIENLDPMGVHTGDSITVAPAQTLTDKEYQRMRNASIDVLRKIRALDMCIL